MKSYYYMKNSHNDDEIKRIFEFTNRENSNLDSLFGKEINHILIKSNINNPDKQMFLGPYFFYLCLKNKSQIDKNLITELGLINAYFWTSFIIYDDAWDKEECFQESLLPIANFMSRQVYIYYEKAFKQYSFDHKHLLDKADASNYKEIKECRYEVDIENNRIRISSINKNLYKNYLNKYYPAASHMFGPLIILASLGYNLKSKQVRVVEAFYKNYLIARQLSDDLTDFISDLKKGHLSTVVHETLMQLKMTSEEYEIDKLIVVFFEKTLAVICKRIIDHCNLALSEIEKIDIFDNTKYLTASCISIKICAQKAINDSNKVLGLIDAIG